MAGRLSAQWHLFKMALSFYTTVPVPFAEQDFSDPKVKAEYDQQLSQISGYFAVIGILVGLTLALCLFTLNLLFPISVAVTITLIFGVLLTGALHEDGLADICDGFGGGYTLERKLEIMKDSQLGVYGASALLLAFLLKFTLLTELFSLAHLTFWDSVFVFVIAQSLSRALSLTISFSLTYARDKHSKVGGIVASISKESKQLLALSALLPILYFGGDIIIALAITAFITRYLLCKLYLQQLGGYTGDCLGAAQQIFELVIYTCLLVMLTPAKQLFEVI